MMTRWLFVVLLLGMTPVAAAMEDTPENRAQQVERYLQAVPPKALFDDIMSKMFRNLPEDQREIFTGDLSKGFDFQAFTDLMRAAMLKTFTADELAALADFYGSPVGKSAMSKMGDYMAELLPLLTAELNKSTPEMEESTKQPKE